MSKKKEEVHRPEDKAEEFIEPFCRLMDTHPQIIRIRIEGKKTNTVIERTDEEKETDKKD